MSLSCFKAYDVRGRYPDELNEDTARRTGYAFARLFHLKNVVIGHDARLSGPALYGAFAEGLCAAGANVTGLGLCGTEEIYFASFAGDFDGGVMVTGSHNPADENGFKLVLGGAVPVSGDSGLFALRDSVAGMQAVPRGMKGSFAEESFRSAYVEHLLSYVRPERLRPFRIAADPGNGCAGPVVRALAEHLPFHVTLIREKPDGTFPGGVPNPLLPENRCAASRAVQEYGADFGLAWDGDFDRCFFYDASGRFLEGYYLVGMMAEALLRDHPGEKIIHDPRLVWNTRELVAKAGGVAVESRTGHAFIKERMRAENALYGGEMSAHHYFRSFAYCDSGMIPWLLVAHFLSEEGKTLEECVSERMKAFPCSGEINSRVEDAARTLSRVEDTYAVLPGAEVTRIDGLSVAFPAWRFNLRSSQTEPVLRLNVESRGDEELMQRKTEELLALIRQ